MRFTKLEFVKQAMAQADADGIRPLESVKAAVKVISDQEEKDFYRRVKPFSLARCSASTV